MNCNALEEKLVLYLYEELPAEEQAQVSEHVAACARCREHLEALQRLHQTLRERPVRHLPDGGSAQALAECRLALSRALEDEPNPAGLRALLGAWLPGLPASPAFGGAVLLGLLAVSFNLGWMLRSRVGPKAPGAPNVSMGSVSVPDLSGMRINGITGVTPDPQTGEIRVTVDAERRVTLNGSLDDPRIQQVLLYAVKADDNAGIRRETLDALRPRADNPKVRQVLLYAMENDPNPGVRLEALEAAQGLEWGDDARRAFLQVVERDENPGLRVAAVDVLVGHADDAVLPTFERLAAQDSNRYVRLKCASAIRNLRKGNE